MTGLDRRVLLAGLGAMALPSGPVRGQQPGEPQIPDAPIQLVRNLFTRVGVRVLIDGRGPFIFVIDTGAGATSLSDTLAAGLALRPLAPVLVHGITEARVTPSVAVPRLSLAGAGFRNLACPVFQREQLGADGLVGLDVLGRFRLKFDVSRRSASLSPPGLSIRMGGDLGPGSRLPREGIRTVRGRFGQLIMGYTTVDGQQSAAFVDSGAQYSIGNLALRRAVAARRRHDGPLGSEVPIYGVTGQTRSADLALVDDLRLGSHRLGPTPILFTDLHCFDALDLSDRPALLIGADLLSRFREVTLDFRANTVAFKGLLRQTTGRLDLQAS